MDPWASRGFGRRGPTGPSSSALSPSKSSSPVLTPRRHGAPGGGGGHHHHSMDESDSARRYEAAEGSASTSPPLAETPPYLRWAENLHFLLADPDGVELFEKFLDQENCSHLLKVSDLIIRKFSKSAFLTIFLYVVLVCLRRPQATMDRGSRQSRPNYSGHSQKVHPTKTGQRDRADSA